MSNRFREGDICISLPPHRHQVFVILAVDGSTSSYAAMNPADGKRYRLRDEALKKIGVADLEYLREPESGIRMLRDAIVEVLGNRGRSTLKTIAEDIEASGYKTNSKKFTNTVRVQLYRLDDDGAILIHEDGTFSLHPY